MLYNNIVPFKSFDIANLGKEFNKTFDVVINSFKRFLITFWQNSKQNLNIIIF